MEIAKGLHRLGSSDIINSYLVVSEGGVTITEPNQPDQDEAAIVVASFWDDWAKSKGPDAANAVKQVRAALGR